MTQTWQPIQGFKQHDRECYLSIHGEKPRKQRQYPCSGEALNFTALSLRHQHSQEARNVQETSSQQQQQSWQLWVWTGISCSGSWMEYSHVSASTRGGATSRNIHIFLPWDSKLTVRKCRYTYLHISGGFCSDRQAFTANLSLHHTFTYINIYILF